MYEDTILRYSIVFIRAVQKEELITLCMHRCELGERLSRQCILHSITSLSLSSFQCPHTYTVRYGHFSCSKHRKNSVTSRTVSSTRIPYCIKSEKKRSVFKIRNYFAILSLKQINSTARILSGDGVVSKIWHEDNYPLLENREYEACIS